MVVGLLSALLAALAYGSGTVLQAVGVRAIAALADGASVLRRVRAGWCYALGLVVDGIGFVAAVVALRTLPLFLVESAIASSVAVTAVLSVAFLGIRLQRNESIALGAVVIGLAMLGSSAQDGPAITVGQAAGWWLLVASLGVVGLLLMGLRTATAPTASVVLSAAAGLGFGLLGIAARLLVIPDPWWRAVTSPMLWSLLVGGGLGIVGYGLALARGRATSVAAVTFAVETVVPASIGLAWLGDTVRAGLWPLAALGFLLTLSGCLALAGRAEPTTLVSEAAPGP